MRAKHVLSCTAIAFALLLNPAHAAGITLLQDDFRGPVIDRSLWRMPSRISSGDGTFVGRTRFRVVQNSDFPEIRSGGAVLPLQTYNAGDPAEGSFWGSELIAKRSFALGEGLDIVVRARLSTTRYSGLVGGIFLYALKPGSDSLHDEIDFELLTNLPDRVQTNIYGNEPLGIGHTELIPYAKGTMADDHTYEIRWRKDSVSWLIDGRLVRTATKDLPAGPMELHLNIWAPDKAWGLAYSPMIQPSASAAANEMLAALVVESVTVKALGP
jgi:hypothetical protein